PTIRMLQVLDNRLANRRDRFLMDFARHVPGANAFNDQAALAFDLVIDVVRRDVTHLALNVDVEWSGYLQQILDGGWIDGDDAIDWRPVRLGIHRHGRRGGRREIGVPAGVVE